MLCKELKEVGGGLIKHIDLWNHNAVSYTHLTLPTILLV